jgi:hypothetical protein
MIDPRKRIGSEASPPPAESEAHCDPRPRPAARRCKCNCCRTAGQMDSEHEPFRYTPAALDRAARNGHLETVSCCTRSPSHARTRVPAVACACRLAQCVLCAALAMARQHGTEPELGLVRAMNDMNSTGVLFSSRNAVLKRCISDAIASNMSLPCRCARARCGGGGGAGALPAPDGSELHHGRRRRRRGARPP